MMDPQLLAGRYQVDAVIGDGGMARVYRAYDTRLGRTVALKILREQFAAEDQFIERFNQEARLAARLSHPNIIGVYDVGVDQGRYFIVMEYVQGENLKQVIVREAPMSLGASLPLLRQLAAALDYAHEQGVIHRDIKPENILVTDRRVVRVGDFGIARALSSTTLTATGTVMGSASYFSPEQASGQAVTAESDLYSMGIVLFEMLTGQTPFAGPNPVAVAMAQLNDPPPSLRGFRPDLSPATDAMVQKALAKRPSDRFHSGAELIAALEATQGGGRMRRSTTVAAAALPTMSNAPAAALPADARPHRGGSAGALAALVTTAALLIAAVLVARSLASSDHSADGGTATPTVGAGAPAAGAGATPRSAASPSAIAATGGPGPTTTAQPGGNSSSTPLAPSATPAVQATATLPVATATPLAATATPAPPTDTPGPTITPVSGSLGKTTLQLITAKGVGDNFTPAGPTSSFPKGTGIVYAFAIVRNKPVGAGVVFHWTYPDGSSFNYPNDAIAPYKNTIGYAELTPRGAGTYSVSASIKGHQLASISFTVGGKAASAALASPSSAVVVPTTVAPGQDGNGQGQGHGNGNGNGKGHGDGG